MTGNGIPRAAADNPTEFGGWSLRSVQQSDVPMLYSWVMDPRVNHRWTTRGTLVPFDAFTQRLWDDVLVSLLVMPDPAGPPVAWASVTSADLHSGYASAAVVVDPAYPTTAGIGPRSVCLLLRYIFAVHPLRKIYFESPEFAAHDFRTALGELLAVEGILREHLYYHGRYWDKYILAVTTHSWSRNGTRYMERAFRHSLPTADDIELARSS